MKTTELLHFAFRARDPMALGRWFAEQFEAGALCEPEQVEAALAQLRAQLSEQARNVDSGGVPPSLSETQMQQQQQQ